MSLVFWYFQGVKKETSGLKEVKIPAAVKTMSFFWKIKQLKNMHIIHQKEIFSLKIALSNLCWRQMYWLRFHHKIKFLIQDSFT